MAVYKRGKIYWVRFTAPNGQRIRRSAGTGSKQEAQEFHDRLRTDFWRLHKLGDKPRRTWQDAAVQWLKDRDQKADLKRDVEKLRWLDQYFGGMYLDEISRPLIHQVAQTKKLATSPSTANRYLALIRAMLRAARDEWEWIDKIPAVRLYKEPKKRVRWITPNEAHKLLEQLPEHLADMAAFTLATGLRQRNVSYLRWEQVDLERNIAWIHADQSKSRKAIAVPLIAEAQTVLLRRVGRHSVYVFTYQDKPVERTSTRAWQKALKRAGIEKFRWHDLRHTWASWHVQRGTSTQELMELGGWSSFEMVLRYAHLASDHLKGAAMRLEGTMLAQPTKTIEDEQS